MSNILARGSGCTLIGCATFVYPGKETYEILSS